MADPKSDIELTFLGSGNAFAAEGRAFSSVVLNGRYLFDCGPTFLQQIRKARIETNDIKAIFISHFHSDHFFGLPFFLLDAWRSQRTEDLVIVGPPNVEAKLAAIMAVGYELVPGRLDFKTRYIEARDGLKSEAAGLPFTASSVIHVPELECFAYRVQSGGRTVVYSGDTTLCDGLTRLVPGADVLVLECSCGVEPVHLKPADIAQIRAIASPHARIVLTHLDGLDKPGDFDGLLVATDLGHYVF